MNVLRRIVWAAVFAALLCVASIVFAVAGNSEVSISLGLSAVACAVLSNREK